MRYIYASIITVFYFQLCTAQSFDYSLQTTSGSFNYLEQKTILSESEDWKTQIRTIPIGFAYSILDSTFDTLTIESNGFIVFGGDKRYAIAAFNEIIPIADTLGVIKSSMSYYLEGNIGTRILKIEYKNCGFSNDGTDESFSYQIWLYESAGQMEIRIGSRTPTTGIDITPLIGLINMNRDSEVSGFLIYGNATSPQSKQLNESEDLVYIDSVPSEGTIYLFIPQL